MRCDGQAHPRAAARRHGPWIRLSGGALCAHGCWRNPRPCPRRRPAAPSHPDGRTPAWRAAGPGGGGPRTLRARLQRAPGAPGWHDRGAGNQGALKRQLTTPGVSATRRGGGPEAEPRGAPGPAARARPRPRPRRARPRHGRDGGFRSCRSCKPAAGLARGVRQRPPSGGTAAGGEENQNQSTVQTGEATAFVPALPKPDPRGGPPPARNPAREGASQRGASLAL